MAIDTNTKKLAVMEMGDYWEPGLPLAPGATFEQGELQQLLWGYPGLSWVTATLQFILDMNTRIMAYLCTLYGADMATADNSALTTRYLNAQTGEYTARFQKLIDDATP